MSDKKKVKRFDFLEGKKKSDLSDQTELPQVGRFEHLEIGQIRKPPQPKPKPDAPMGRVMCGRCGQTNEAERETCWACYKPLAPRAEEPKPAAQEPAARGPQQEITLVIDGLTYSSNDPSLPEDIRVLMDRIRSEGFSQRLLDEWRGSRSSRPVSGSSSAREERRVEAFQGTRVSVIKVDGTVYLSDAPDLPPRIRDLFSYIDRNGVTPELMENLRAMGRDARVRPATTATPSDGDLAFWREVEDQRRQTQGQAREAGAAIDSVAHSFYYLAPFWFLVETLWWPFFRAGLVTGGGGIWNLLFYAAESAIGVGFWQGLAWARHVALLENVLYLAVAFDNVFFGTIDAAVKLDTGGSGRMLAAQNFTKSLPGFLFSCFFIIFSLRRAAAARRGR
ncbi:MAG: hypothetical protein HZB91_14165 [Elusimicrobia bacterium]|nr:hypothetical protein [Elusimicrobiota bacterium]